MTHLALVALGGAIGAALRHLAGMAAIRLLGTGFPWGTFLVNIVGSLAMGILIAVLARRSGTPSEIRLFLATGMLGGFTTFSAFSMDVALLWERGEVVATLGYVAGSVIISILALFAGLWLVRSIA